MMDTYVRITPPEITRRFVALNGYAIQEEERWPISAEVEATKEGELLLRGEGPPELVLGRRGKYRAELKNPTGWRVSCENCLNSHANFNGGTSSFTARMGKVTALFDPEPDAETSESFAVLVGGNGPFSGDIFDQYGSRSVIELDYTGRSGALLGAALDWGDKEIGYLYLQCEGNPVGADWEIINRIIAFASLAYASFIRVPWYGRFGKNGGILIEMYPVSHDPNSPGFLYVGYPFQLSKLISNGWGIWDTTGRGLELVHLINQYILMRTQVFIDAALILGCIWMEAFKHQYAQNVKNYTCTTGGYFLKPGNTNNRYSFIELVEEGMLHFGITNPYLEFKDVRNEVIHTGVITGTMEEKIEENIKLGNAIEEFFLSLFRFDGLVWDYRLERWVDRTLDNPP